MSLFLLTVNKVEEQEEEVEEIEVNFNNHVHCAVIEKTHICIVTKSL